MELVRATTGIFFKTSSVSDAVDDITNGVGTLYQIGREKAYTVAKAIGVEKGCERAHNMVKNNSEVIFWAVALVNIWQNALMFVGGVGIGVVLGGAGEKMGIIDKAIQLIKTKEALTGYNYLTGALFFVLATWLSSLQSGIVAGNYLSGSALEEDKKGIFTQVGELLQGK